MFKDSSPTVIVAHNIFTSITVDSVCCIKKVTSDESSASKHDQIY